MRGKALASVEAMSEMIETGRWGSGRVGEVLSVWIDVGPVLRNRFVAVTQGLPEMERFRNKLSSQQAGATQSIHPDKFWSDRIGSTVLAKS